MSNLTDADMKAFIDKMAAGLEGNKATLIAGHPAIPGSGWDPTVRIASLQAGEVTVTADETLISQLEVALATAVATRRQDLEANYALASVSVSAAEGALGKDHPFVIDLHQIRGGMSHAPKPAPPKP